MPWRKKFDFLLGHKSSKCDSALQGEPVLTSPFRSSNDTPGSCGDKTKVQYHRKARSMTGVHDGDDSRSFESGASSEMDESRAYDRAYATGVYDLNSPPLRPLSKPSGSPEQLTIDPRISRGYIPHVSPEQALKKAAVAQLDISSEGAVQRCESPATSNASNFGSSFPRPSSERSSSELPSESSSSAARTQLEPLKDNIICRDIVKRTRERFDAPNAILTVADEDQLIFLASSSADRRARPLEAVLPFHATLCAHTALNHERGLVVPDTLKDWRFKDSLPTTDLGVRFYAAFPIRIPVTLTDYDSPRVSIGSLCLVSETPKDDFTQQDAVQLRELADDASYQIEAWARTRLDVKLSRLEQDFDSWDEAATDIFTEQNGSIEDRKRAVYDLTVDSISSSIGFGLVYVVSVEPVPDWCALPPIQRVLSSVPPLAKIKQPYLIIEALKKADRMLGWESESKPEKEGEIRLAILKAIEWTNETRGIVLAAMSRNDGRLIREEDVMHFKRIADTLQTRIPQPRASE